MPVCCIPKCRTLNLGHRALFKIQGNWEARESWKKFCADNGNITSKSLLLCDNHFSSEDLMKVYGKYKLSLNSKPVYNTFEEKKVILSSFNQCFTSL